MTLEEKYDFEYFKRIGPLFDDDGNNVDGKVKDFIIECLVKERNDASQEFLKAIRSTRMRVPIWVEEKKEYIDVMFDAPPKLVEAIESSINK